MSSFTNSLNNNEQKLNQDSSQSIPLPDNNSSKKQEEHKVEVLGIGLDTSGSMNGILKTVVDEGKGVIDALNPESIVFCEFSSNFECYSLNKEKAKERMDQVIAQGGTAMYDGVTTMLKELIKKSLDGKKVMVLIITDGYENASIKFTKKDLEESKSKLRELAGDDCIREICIGYNLEEANRLMKSTPGLNRDTSATTSRDPRLLSSVIRSLSNPTAPSNQVLDDIKKEDDYTDEIRPL